MHTQTPSIHTSTTKTKAGTSYRPSTDNYPPVDPDALRSLSSASPPEIPQVQRSNAAGKRRALDQQSQQGSSIDVSALESVPQYTEEPGLSERKILEGLKEAKAMHPSAQEGAAALSA